MKPKMYKSGQPEILRAAQRDEVFLGQLNESVTELLQFALGIRTWMKFKEYAKHIPELIYYSLTTLSNRQTLGEEYTGIFQMHCSGRSLQPKHVQLLMILLSTCGEKLLMFMLGRVENNVKDMSNSFVKPFHREYLMMTIDWIRNLTPFIKGLHKSVFYLNGEYYDIGKRLTQTRYALIRYWLKDRSTLPAFRVLGIISFIHVVLRFFLRDRKQMKSFPEQLDSVKNKASGVVSSRNACPLCLNSRKNTSSISCGHLFCWDCIISWLQQKPQCPLCRKSSQPSRVILLQNF